MQHRAQHLKETFTCKYKYSHELRLPKPAFLNDKRQAGVPGSPLLHPGDSIWPAIIPAPSVPARCRSLPHPHQPHQNPLLPLGAQGTLGPSGGPDGHQALLVGGHGGWTGPHLFGWGWMFALLACVYGGVALFVWGAPVLDGESARGQGEGRRGPKDVMQPWKVWRKLLSVPGTPWTMFYVLTYKLGEQGAITMFPLFLLDHHMTARELGLWNGVVAMAFSICGSSIGGFLLSQYSIGLLMRRVFMIRTISMVFQSSLLVVLEPSPLMKGMAVLSLSLQHFIAGLITTLTFTTMMNCTQRAEESIQATHYSFLATLEVLGKLSFSALAGGMVDTVGFPIAFILFLFLTSSSALHVWRATETGVLKEQLKEQPK
ncbi:major facilitator superfamily domain-containing protein 3 isoform X2 [Chanodichthys erythropterus]|uniref:major facilitator superfamily domain-containing protein 3 isoform X2 n=1 Tax=Chanodichthys erythropterus TaxID=933992 RepID=UPI00351E8936